MPTPPVALPVLLVDDQPLPVHLLRQILREEPEFVLHVCQDPTEAIALAERVRPAVILLDLIMPIIGGMELLRQLRALPATAEIPVILLSVEENPDLKAEGFASGANDYLIKLPAKVELIARLRYHANAFRTRQSLQWAEEKYRKLFEHSRDAIFLTEVSSGMIVDCNAAALRLMAMPKAQIVGKNQAELHSSREAKVYKALYDQHVRFRLPITTEIFIQRPNGNRVPVDVSAVIFQQGEHHYSQWMFQDISERRQLLKSLEETLTIAESANRAKSEFLATMSHEIRTPMNTIIGMGEILRETPLNDDQKNYVAMIQRAGEALLALINDILDISKIEAGQFALDESPFHLPRLAEETMEFFTYPAREKMLTLTLHITPEVPVWVNGDGLRLRQILNNLLGNALKFTPQDGKITLQIKPANRTGETGMLLFAVTDTGIGIPLAKQGMVFEAFTQADSSTTRRFGGTGLGLSICKRLVELMGGRIGVKSQPGDGSTFYFSIPLETREPAPPRPEESSPRSTPEPLPRPCRRTGLRPTRLLIADDAEDNRLLIQIFLKNEPYEMDLAVNGLEALTRYQNGTYDLVLMDMQMPEMDGYAATGRIREWETANNRQRTPIVAVTAGAMQEEREASRLAGCDEYLLKPITKARLLAVIERWVR